MWLDSIQSTVIDMAAKALSASALRPGTTSQATVEGSSERPVLVAGGSRLPLPEGTHLTPGQQVQVEVLDTGKGIQLRITSAPPEAPQTQPQTAGAAGTAVSADSATNTGMAGALSRLDAADAVVARVLNALGQKLESPAQLLPRALPRTDDLVRSVISLFTRPASTGADLETISSLIAQAASEGALPETTAQDATALMARLVPRDAAKLEPVLQQWARGLPVEAQIAKAILSNRPDALSSSLREDLRAVLSQIRNNEGFTAFLQQKDASHSFHSATDRVIDRVTAGQMQNLHSIEHPYLFVEMPFPAGAPLREARIHLFHEGHGAARDSNKRSATVTLDLSTTRLGDLWITLQFAEGHCACRIATTTEETVGVISAAQGELTEALEGAGYTRATVHIGLWDGNRLRETARLMRRFSGIDVKA